MADIKLFDASGKANGTLAAPNRLANSNAKMALVHQVAVAEAAGRRQGTSKVLRRDEVTGSTVKIRRQKGTGRSRQGDKRVPHMRGGGVVHGPRPRDYGQDTPRKMRQSAFRTGLNSRLQNDALFVIDGLSFDAPKTKSFVALQEAMGLAGKKLLVLVGENDMNLALSGRNVPKVIVQEVEHTNLTDVLRCDVVVCTRDAWNDLEARINAGASTRANSVEASV